MQVWLGDATLWVLENAISGTSKRHELILANLANLETPGYQRQDVSFKDALARAIGRDQGLPLRRTHWRHLPNQSLTNGSGEVVPTYIRNAGVAARADGNTVSPDEEMALLAANALEQQTLITLASRRLAALRTVIHEGRR